MMSAVLLSELLNTAPPARTGEKRKHRTTVRTTEEKNKFIVETDDDLPQEKGGGRKRGPVNTCVLSDLPWAKLFLPVSHVHRR